MNINFLLNDIKQYFIDLSQSAYTQSGHWEFKHSLFFLSKKYSKIEFSFYDGKILIADKNNIHFHSTKCQGRHDIEFTYNKEDIKIVVFESYMQEEHKKWNEDPFNNKSGVYAYIESDNLSIDDIACEEENLYFSQENAFLIKELNLFFKNQLDNKDTEFKARLWITPEFASQFEKNKISELVSASPYNKPTRI